MYSTAHSSLELVRRAATTRRAAPGGVVGAASPASPAPRAESFDALEHLVGVNLARLRAERQLSLDALARASGVSARDARANRIGAQRAVHQGAVQGGRRVEGVRRGLPATSRDERFRALAGGAFVARRPFQRTLFGSPALSRQRADRRRVSRTAHRAVARRSGRAPRAGTTVNLVVSEGTLEVSVHDQRQLLATGDAIVFDADQPHSLRNPGDTEARAFRVTLKAETPPRWDVPAQRDTSREAAPV